MPRESDRPSVVVKHVGNKDVEHHVTLIGVKKKQRVTRASLGGLASGFFNTAEPVAKKKSKPTSNGTEDALSDEEMTISERIKKVTIADDANKTSVSGANVYTFKTPKRAKQMTKFASESVKKIRSQKSKENVDPTPNGESSRWQTKKYSIQEMGAIANESASTEESHSEAESEEDDIPAEGGNYGASSRQKIDLPAETELYFEAHRAGRKLGGTTSDRTLSKLKNVRMNREEMQHILKQHNHAKYSSKNTDNTTREVLAIEAARQRLLQAHTRNFRKWMFYICNGYNILLYGLGSKRNLVHDFCKRELKGFDKIVINGYFPSLTTKSILTSITEDIVKDTPATTGGQAQSQLDKICQIYSEDGAEELFLIIHNIDGAMLRNNSAQGILSQLSECPKIHVIATIDHINAPLIWDQAKLCKYKWLWYDVTTYEPYADETSYEDSLMLLTSSMGVGGSLALSGLIHVARSLTPNARGIFLLIVKSQMAEDKDEHQKGLSFSDLYQQCRERFLVNSELTLRSQLTEFLDHKLVQIRKGVDGGEYLTIPLDNSTLQEYLDQAPA